jgi:hypothetical protein
LTHIVRLSTAGSARGAETVPPSMESDVYDVWFVLLTLAIFGLLALCVKGVGKL